MHSGDGAPFGNGGKRLISLTDTYEQIMAVNEQSRSQRIDALHEKRGALALNSRQHCVAGERRRWPEKQHVENTKMEHDAALICSCCVCRDQWLVVVQTQVRVLEEDDVGPHMLFGLLPGSLGCGGDASTNTQLSAFFEPVATIHVIRLYLRSRWCREVEGVRRGHLIKR